MGDNSRSTKPPPLVGVRWLCDHLDDPSVRVVEAGSDASAYYEGHVPGAVAISWLDELQEPDRRGVLSQVRLEQLLGSLGISEDTHIVLYGDDNNAYAAYAYWLLRYYGHSRLSLLDGGRRTWLGADVPITADRPPVEPYPYVSTGPHDDVRVTRDEILQRFVGAPEGTVLIDCRSPAEFHGHAEMIVDLPLLLHRLAGHIPGARNLSLMDMVDPATSRFLPVRDLQQAVTGHGVAPDDDVVVYCEVGQRSALGWFVLHELLGHERTRNYDGGWAEYGSLVGAPVSR